MIACHHMAAVPLTTLLEGQTVYCCRDCRSLRLVGCEIWVAGGPGCLDQLRVMAEVLRHSRELRSQMLHSDIADPRWSWSDTV